MLAGPSEAVRPTGRAESHAQKGFRTRPSCSEAFFSCITISSIGSLWPFLKNFFFCTSIGQYLQNEASSSISKTLPLRCFAAFSGCGIGNKKKGRCGLARFSELLRILLIDREHLSHSDTLAYQKKKAVSANLRLACVLIARPFCLLVGTPDVNARISRSALSLRYCVSEAEYSSEVFPLSVFISGALSGVSLVLRRR